MKSLGGWWCFLDSFCVSMRALVLVLFFFSSVSTVIPRSRFTQPGCRDDIVSSGVYCFCFPIPVAMSSLYLTPIRYECIATDVNFVSASAVLFFFFASHGVSSARWYTFYVVTQFQLLLLPVGNRFLRISCYRTLGFAVLWTSTREFGLFISLSHTYSLVHSSIIGISSVLFLV